MLLAIIVAVVCVLADLAGKYAAVHCLADSGSVPLIKDVIHFTYVENRGMAFGMLADHRAVFMILSSVLLITIVIFLFVMRKSSGRFLQVTCGLVLGGGIGNMIDRIRLGYVVDFIDVRLFGDLWKWVFNIADACVCIGVFLLAVYLLADSFKEKKKKLQPASESDEPGADEPEEDNE